MPQTAAANADGALEEEGAFRRFWRLILPARLNTGGKRADVISGLTRRDWRETELDSCSVPSWQISFHPPLLWFFHPLLLGLCKSVMRCHPLPNKGRDLPSQQLGGVRAYPTTAQGNSFTAPTPYRSLQPRAGSLLCPVCEKTMRDVKIVLSLNSESFISIFFDSWPLAVLPCYHTFVASRSAVP